MKTLRAVLAVILLVYSIPTLLSALDILRGTEPDLGSEWIIVSIFFVLSVLFAAVTVVEFLRGKEGRTGRE
jgi:membrane protease YdiL (CAAX protease family)